MADKHNTEFTTNLLPFLKEIFHSLDKIYVKDYMIFILSVHTRFLVHLLALSACFWLKNKCFILGEWS